MRALTILVVLDLFLTCGLLGLLVMLTLWLRRRLNQVRAEVRASARNVSEIASTTGAIRLYTKRAENSSGAVRDIAWVRSAWQAEHAPPPSESDSERRARLSDPRRVRVAAILDEFSWESFAPECDLNELLPDSWRRTVEERKPDLFLCESAWSGRDSRRHPWQGKIYTRTTVEPTDRRGELLAILDYCRLHGIPTVFWNKEDPIHSKDPERNFVRTALEFDHIFTTDSNCLPMYSALGRPDAQVLQFGYQPRIFYEPTPEDIAEHPRLPIVVFPGGWYADHPQRCSEMEQILDEIIVGPYELVIYDRFSGHNDPLHVFPEKYQPYCRPAVPYTELAQIYRRAQFGLTINTVTDSPTMYARRAVEMLASGMTLLSNFSVGLEKDFGDNTVFINCSSGVWYEALTRVEGGRDREGLSGRLVNRSYRAVLDRILAHLGLLWSNSESSPG